LLKRLFMRYFFLLLLTGCVYHNLENDDCMTQSESLPLQWYLDGVPSFNTRNVPGIENRCYFRPWRCDVPIVDQFYDANARSYAMRAIDSKGNQIFEKFYHTSNLVDSLQDWIDIGSDPDSNWSDIGTDEPYVDLPSGAAASDRIKGNVALEADKTYRFFFRFGGTVATLNVYVRFRLSGSITTPIPVTIAGFNGVDDVTGYFDYTPDSDVDDVAIYADKVSGAAGRFTLKSFTMYETNRQNANVIYDLSFVPEDEGLCKKLVKFEIWDLSEDDEAPVPVRVAYTDLINFSSNVAVNVFEYSSTKNYDKLIYDLPVGQEVPVFKICIESVFFHDREITEEVSVDLTTEVVGTATRITTQKLLAIQPAPDEIHRKIQKVLSHGLIGKLYDQTWLKYWIKQEKYEKGIDDQHAGLKVASIYLTEAYSPTSGTI